MICLSIFSVFRFTSVDGDELVSHSGGGSVGGLTCCCFIYIYTYMHLQILFLLTVELSW